MITGSWITGSWINLEWNGDSFVPQWVPGLSAGGCRNNLNLFSTNPQVRLPHKQPKETQQPQNPSITTNDHLLVPADVTTRGGRTLRRLIFHPGRSEVPGFLKNIIGNFFYWPSFFASFSILADPKCQIFLNPLFLVCLSQDDYLSQVIICLSQEHRRSKRDRKVGDDKYLRIHQTNEIGNQS